MNRLSNPNLQNSIFCKKYNYIGINLTLRYTCQNCVYVMCNSYEYGRICCDQCLSKGHKNCPDCVYHKKNDNGEQYWQKKSICCCFYS